MTKYITRNGRELSEEVLKDIYRVNTFTTFNERDYEAWKNSKLKEGVIKIAE